MSQTTPQLPDANALVQRLKQGLADMLAAQSAHLVGIASGGAWLARQLHEELGLAGRCSVVSSSLHRDDFSTRGFANAERTDITFDINGAHVILVDDVLYTGRTIRAVVNELYDHGRPASVRLAVLVDRGGRQLPIQPDFAAHTEALAAGRSLALRRGTASDDAAPGFHLRWKD